MLTRDLCLVSTSGEYTRADYQEEDLIRFFRDNSLFPTFPELKRTILHKAVLRCTSFSDPPRNVICFWLLYSLPCIAYQRLTDAILKSKKVDVNAVDKFNCTALHYAVFRRNRTLVEALLAANASVRLGLSLHTTPRLAHLKSNSLLHSFPRPPTLVLRASPFPWPLHCFSDLCSRSPRFKTAMETRRWTWRCYTATSTSSRPSSATTSISSPYFTSHIRSSFLIFKF